jgi:actin-related protein 6
MMDEFYIVNEVKEKTCYISKNFVQELSIAANTTTTTAASNCTTPHKNYEKHVDFLLPDFVNTFEGTVVSCTTTSTPSYPNSGAPTSDAAIVEDDESSSNSIQQTKVEDEEEEDDESDVEEEEETDEQRRVRIKRQRQEEQRRRELEEQERQVLKISTERFTVPEVLFSPSYVGLHRQCGIVDAIYQSVEACPAYLRAAMYQNILLIGGNAKFPNMRERIENDLRKLVNPSYKVVRVVSPTASNDDDPTEYAWKGAEQFISSRSTEEELFPRFSVDKNTWERHFKTNESSSGLWTSIEKNFLYDENVT